MTRKNPPLVNLKNIDKTPKTVKLVCAGCKREFERKAGRVFICLFCGSDKCS